MKQFEITPIIEGPKFGPIDTTFTNSSLWMMIAVLGVIVLFGLGSGRKLIPGRLQSFGEICYEFIMDMLRETTGPEAVKFFPLVFALFFFILFANLLGMNPWAFTTTSHLAVTAALSFFVVGMVFVIGIIKNGTRFFKIFAPSGLPFIMYFLIVPIEIISFIARPVALSVRLFANMMAGHVMLKVFAIFIAFLVGSGGVLAGAAIVPIIGTTAIVALEFLVAALQAFVFAILTCVYLNDVYHVDH
ncbi:MAG: F0F1 ATP synthase subunit A [Hellea sp.]|nr:F0F1 ATP synthase subunit A [Hellea sp.]